MAEPAIAARGLRKSFPPVTAVAGLDLAVPQGEIHGLVGPDGAGKTTAMRLIAGAMPADEGTARVAGFDVGSQGEEVKRRLGYVPQRSSLYGELTVDENLLFRARIHGVKGKQYAERRQQLLAFSRLEPFKDRLARNLSGGMKQKLSLACALIHDPQVLLLDEPTTGVDPVSRGEFWELLLNLSAGGTTILTSTPYMDEAERCALVGLLHEGRLLASGAPQEVRAQAGLELLEIACDPLLPGRAAVQQVAGVSWVEIFGDKLHLAARSAGAVEAPVRAALTSAAVRVLGMSRIPTGLEDAFFELVRRGQEQAA